MSEVSPHMHAGSQDCLGSGRRDDINVWGADRGATMLSAISGGVHHDLFGPSRGGNYVWIADNGATSHVTGDADCLFDCHHSPLDQSTPIVGDSRRLSIKCCGKLLIVLHSAKGDIGITLD